MYGIWFKLRPRQLISIVISQLSFWRILNPLVYCLHSEDFRVISTQGITIKKEEKKIISLDLLHKTCGNIQLARKSPKHFLLMCFCSQIPFFHYQISEEPSTPDYYFHFIQPCVKLKNSILTFFLYLLNNHNFLSYMI